MILPTFEIKCEDISAPFLQKNNATSDRQSHSFPVKTYGMKFGMHFSYRVTVMDVITLVQNVRNKNHTGNLLKRQHFRFCFSPLSDSQIAGKKFFHLVLKSND